MESDAQQEWQDVADFWGNKGSTVQDPCSSTISAFLLLINRNQQQQRKTVLTWFLLFFFSPSITKKLNPKGGCITAKESWEGRDSAAAPYHPISAELCPCTLLWELTQENFHCLSNLHKNMIAISVFITSLTKY